MKEEKEAKKRQKQTNRKMYEERWKAYCEDQRKEELRKLKELNQTEQTQIHQTRSEGHSLSHPEEVTATITGGLRTYVHTSKERVREYDPSTETQASGVGESGSGGHFRTHPNKVEVTVTDGHTADIHALSERAREDDPSTDEERGKLSLTMTSEEVDSEEEDLPPLIRIKDEEGEPVQRELDFEETGSSDLELDSSTGSSSSSSSSSESSSSSSSSSGSEPDSDTEEEGPSHELLPIKRETLPEGSWAKGFADHPNWERQGYIPEEDPRHNR
jgi:hypothetical protein